MPNKIKLLFIVPSMRGGGAERVISILLQYLDTDRYSISLALLQKEGKFLDDVPKTINIIDLNSKRVRYSIVKIISLIKSEKPNIVFSTLGHLNLLISILRPFLSKNIVFIGRESNTVSLKNKESQYPKLMNFLYSKFYSNFDYLVAQAQYMKDDLVQNYKISSEKIVVINNPIDFGRVYEFSDVIQEPLYEQDKINLIAVGKLSNQKGFDTLIEIMKMLDERYCLTILGKGPDYNKLQQMINMHDLSHKIRLIGFVNNPYPYMKQADIFVLSSRYEGFPNVVLEANACGTPVIAFDCPGGTNEIIIDNKNGWLVSCQNKQEFVSKIKSVDYKREIEKEHLMKFEVSQIIYQYDELFKKVKN